MAKNIVILSDGTGQQGGRGYNSNVYKMFNIIEDRTKDQIVYYDPGLGTSGFKWLKQLSGLGISKNIKDCYQFLFENYESGDRIYLIGFSRGAATIRSLSSFIHHFGILPKSRPDLIKQAYKIYSTRNRAALQDKAERFISKHHTMWIRVKFLGCFDTVDALGFPLKKVSAILNQIPFFKHEFHDFKLSKSVENAYHALAVDDKRKTFYPVLWKSELSEYQSLRQVWFPGMHTDVGGGYREHGLSDLSLIWMCRKAVEKGLRIYDPNRITMTPDPGGMMHDSRGKWWQKIYRKEVRSWPQDRPDNPVIHESVLERAKESDYNPWILDCNYEVEPRAYDLPLMSGDERHHLPKE